MKSTSKFLTLVMTLTVCLTLLDLPIHKGTGPTFDLPDTDLPFEH